MINVLIWMLLATFAFSEPEELIEIDKAVQWKSLEGRKIAYYNVKIPEDIERNKKFLIFDIYVPENDPISDPDIFISQVNDNSQINRLIKTRLKLQVSGNAMLWVKMYVLFQKNK